MAVSLQAGAPIKDPSCALAATVSAYYGTITIQQSTSHSIVSTVNSCGLQGNYAMWFHVVDVSSSTSTVSTCFDYTDFSADFAILSGSCSDLTCVNTSSACSSGNGGQLTFTNDGDFYIAVFGADGSKGKFQLSISFS